ncbi:MAG: glycosyltransferase family 4 protein [bacterium]|nr:glycosyltransferase family 4 protein [bacterium]MDD5755711.1 glycosyltransferase family 4 protein [bacterium]
MTAANVLCLANHERLGGGEKSFIELVNGLDRQVFRPVVIGPQAGPFREAMEATGLKYYPLPIGESAKSGIFGLFSKVRAIRKIIKAEQITLLYACTIKSLLLGRLGSCGKRIPAIWHVRTIKTHGLLDWFIPVFAARIIAISAAVKRKIPDFYEKRIVVLHNAIDLAEATQKSIEFDFRKRYNINPDILLMGVVGRIAPEKGQEYFVRAGAGLVKKYPQVKMVFCGEPFLEVDKRYLAGVKDFVGRENIGDKVLFTGYLDNIWPLVAALDIIVVPSLREGFGRILLEAMIMAKPIVAARVGGIPEIIHHDREALLVPPADTEALSGALEKLIKDETKRRQLGDSGQEYVRENFNQAVYFHNIAKVFHSGLNRDR